MANDAATQPKPIPSNNPDGTPRAWSIQVYAPDGSWCGFFETPKTAHDWVKGRENAGAYRVTQDRPIGATSD